MTPPRLGIDTFWIISSSVKPPAHRAGLPGHAVGSRMRANEISLLIVPLHPTHKPVYGGTCPPLQKGRVINVPSNRNEVHLVDSPHVYHNDRGSQSPR